MPLMLPIHPDSELVIYEQVDPSAGDVDKDGALGLSVWSFGVRYADVLPNGDVLVVYYAGNEKAMDIHWARLRAS